MFTRGAKTHLCYIVWSFCYISASVTTVKYNVSTTVKKIIGCCFVVYLRVGTVFQTAAYFMFVIPRLRPGLLSLRSVLSSRQTDWLDKKININRWNVVLLFCCFVVLLFCCLLESWYCLPDSCLLHVCNPETTSRVTLASLGTVFQTDWLTDWLDKKEISIDKNVVLLFCCFVILLAAFSTNSLPDLTDWTKKYQ